MIGPEDTYIEFFHLYDIESFEIPKNFIDENTSNSP